MPKLIVEIVITNILSLSSFDSFFAVFQDQIQHHLLTEATEDIALKVILMFLR